MSPDTTSGDTRDHVDVPLVSPKVIALNVDVPAPVESIVLVPLVAVKITELVFAVKSLLLSQEPPTRTVFPSAVNVLSMRRLYVLIFPLEDESGRYVP